MKKTIAALAAVALLALTGCSDEPKSWEDDYDSGSSSSSGESLAERKQRIARDLLREQHASTFGGYSDSQVDRIVQATCDGLDDASVDVVFFAGSDVYDPGPMGALLVASAMGYCNEHEAKVRAWMD